MATSIPSSFEASDDWLFLALSFHRGHGSTLVDLIATFDYLNHAIPTAAELDGGLNRLMASGLVEETDGTFRVPEAAASAFAAFAARRKQSRWDSAEKFVRSSGPLPSVERRITIQESDHRAACAEYRKRFEEDGQRTSGKRSS